MSRPPATGRPDGFDRPVDPGHPADPHDSGHPAGPHDPGCPAGPHDPGHRFARPITGPSYRPGFKAITVALLAALALYGAWVLRGASAWSPVLIAPAAAAALLLVAAAPILRGTTTVDTQGIRTSGLTRGALRWEQIDRARYLRVPLSPRLLVLPTSGPMRAFHAGNAALEQAFVSIDRLYRTIDPADPDDPANRTDPIDRTDPTDRTDRSG